MLLHLKPWIGWRGVCGFQLPNFLLLTVKLQADTPQSWRGFRLPPTGCFFCDHHRNHVGKVWLLDGDLDAGSWHKAFVLGLDSPAALVTDAKKLLRFLHARAICAVIGILAWSKARGLTVVLPNFPHRRETFLLPR